MEFLRNIALNLKAIGPAAVSSIWCVAVAAVGIFGGENGGAALSVLAAFGIIIAFTLTQRL